MPRPFKRKRSKYDDVRHQKREARGEQARQNVKRRRIEEQGKADQDENFGEEDFVPLDANNNEQESGQEESEFYGFLTEDEQAYYANVNTKITADDFEDDEDRRNFIEAVHRESNGKELKLASSQSCSRYLERLILVSTPVQLLTLLEKLLEGLMNLAQHRFGSHVLETLFLESAKYVKVSEKKKKRSVENETSSAFELHLVRAAKELEPNFGYLLTDRFGSHVVRVLVLILSGEPLQDAGMQKVLASKRKEKVEAPTQNDQSIDAHRTVPDGFHLALSRLTAAVVSNLDTTYLRALATHPTGNPVLQLLLKIELTNSDKGRSLGKDSLFQKVFTPDSLDDDSEGVKLVSGLMYDPTGSHLIETVVQYAPGKTFKKLYRAAWKPRLPSMAKNDIASYVAIKILERLGKDDLAQARDILVPELQILLKNRRCAVIQRLVDRCVARNTDLKPLAEALKGSIGDKKGATLRALLQIDESASEKEENESPESVKALRADKNGSLLAQSLLGATPVNSLIQDSILATDLDLVLRMAKDPSASRVLQVALTSSASSPAFRKQLVPMFYNHLSDLATNSSGSYLVEALWDGTSGIHFMKERVAGELAQDEQQLRESPYGRNVWRKWSMDLYTRRRSEWQALGKSQSVDQQQSQSLPQPKKNAIQLARERYAAGTKTGQQQSKITQVRGSGPNGIPIK